MNKHKLIELRNSLIAITLAGTIIGFSGCKNNTDNDNNYKSVSINQELSNIDNYYKYIEKEKKRVKVYNSDYIYLFINRESYEISEYLVVEKENEDIEVYDINNDDKLIVYSDKYGTNTTNEDFLTNLLDNNYPVGINEIDEKIAPYQHQDYYSLKTIKKMGKEITSNLKETNQNKPKIKILK